MLTWERALIEPLARHRRRVLSVIAALTLVALVGTLRSQFESSIEIWFVEDDPDLVAYHAFLERFEADEVIVVALFADDVFAPEALEDLRVLTARFGELEYVHRARSMANVDIYELVGEDGEETIVISPVLPAGRLAPEQMRAIREKALANDVLSGSFVARDGRAAVIVVEIDRSAKSITEKTELLDQLAGLIGEVGGGQLDAEIAGGAVFDRGFFEYSEKDFRLLGPVAVVLILLAAWLVFRRLTAALVPLGVVGIAAIWTFGLMGWVGHPIDVLSSGLIVLVMAVGIADTVHVLAEYDRALQAGASGEDAVVSSVAELLVPCLFTSLTTAAGLLSLSVSGLAPVAWFGIFAALGVTAAFILSVTLVPAVLGLVRPPSSVYVEQRARGPMAVALEWLATPSRRRQWVAVAVSGVLLVAAAAAMTTLHMGTNPMNYFMPGDPIRDSTLRVDEAVGGTTTIEFLVEAKERGLTEPALLHRVDALQELLAGQPAVGAVSSVLNALKELNRLWTDGKPASAVVPDTAQKAVQLYGQLENDPWLSSVVRDDYSVGRITARVEMSRAGELASAIPEIEAILRRDYTDTDLHVTATGFVKLMGNMEAYLLDSQVKSLLLAALVVTLMIMGLLRSVRLALYSMIPNILPIVLGLGFMAAVGISLDPGTVMIGSITLGIVVDDTVHFLVRFKRNISKGATLDEAVAWSMHQTGRPIVVTSVVLASSFLALAFGSSFAPNVYFGVISALVVTLALVADLVLLPAVLLLVRPKMQKRDTIPS